MDEDYHKKWRAANREHLAAYQREYKEKKKRGKKPPKMRPFVTHDMIMRSSVTKAARLVNAVLSGSRKYQRAAEL